MKGFKYALMTFDSPGWISERSLELEPGLWTVPGRVPEMFEEEQVQHWREWIGSLNWDALGECDRVAVICAPSDNAEVNDHETLALLGRLARIRRAMLLVGPNGLVWGDCWQLSGQAHGPTHLTGLSSVVSMGPGRRIVRPFYTAPAQATYWATRPKGRGDDSWLERWRDAASLLSAEVPRLLFFGLLAFEHAFDDMEIEFKIPNCVRAIESVVALGHGQGRVVFADRVLQLAPALVGDAYVGGADLRELLVELYELRIDCVHGMVPFAGRNQEDAARLDYLAEFAAREVLLRALRHPQRKDLFGDRDVLELAWRENRFP